MLFGLQAISPDMCVCHWRFTAKQAEQNGGGAGKARRGKRGADQPKLEWTGSTTGLSKRERKLTAPERRREDKQKLKEFLDTEGAVRMELLVFGRR